MGTQKIQLTKVLCIRVTDELAVAIEARAKRLKLRVADVVRMTLATSISTDIPGQQES